MTNELEQNKQIIAELRLMNGKLERLESKISAGLSVKVTSMPAIQVNEAGGKKNKEAAANAKPEVGK